jgi:beta-lactamase class A
MRPTGQLHLGNYHGALKNWVDLQYQYECYFFVADWHALTTGYEDTKQLPKFIQEMLIDWLAAARTGLDRVRAGLPRGWPTGDKTGTGANGAVNDLCLVYPPGRRPIFVAVYMSESTLDVKALSAAHAEIGGLVAREKWR